MSALTSAFEVVLDAALGVWLGSMVFFSFVGAPTAFGVLGEDDAGVYVNATFPKYYVFGTVAGVVAFVAALGLGAVTDFGLVLGVVFLGTAAGVAVFAYSRWVLVPKMEEAGENAFEQYHRRSVVLNTVTMIAVAVALVASHV